MWLAQCHTMFLDWWNHFIFTAFNIYCRLLGFFWGEGLFEGFFVYSVGFLLGGGWGAKVELWLL